ncbi:hypothetical protein ABZV91_26940 [Nocardia sp. NPDC004568]|uniref:hypothetical protein n=1 Tax=Nocardia sp. NPDC004568 TaxID=3154551 RepID=UPI0033A30AB1
MELEAGQVAVVPGAVNGSGHALAVVLVDRGPRVVVADVEAEAKSAIISISPSLRGELDTIAPRIGVTVMCPGPVDTRMFRGPADLAAAPADGVPESETLPPEVLAALAPMREAVGELAKEMLPAARGRIETILESFGRSAG